MKKINEMWTIAGLVILISLAASEKINPAFIVDYYAQRHIKQIVVFACWNEPDIWNYHHHITAANMRSSYAAVEENLNMKGILKVNYYKIGVVLDLDCPQSHTVFDQFAAAKLPFNDSYNWLSFTSAREVPIKILDKLPLTVESELTLTLVEGSRCTLYDVYNHSYRHGGKLNVTAMGYWDESSGLRNHLTQYKYKRRQDFHGLTLNFSIALLTNPKGDLKKFLTEPVDTYLDTMNRFNYNLILKLRDFYNFQIHLTRAQTWGYLVNGTFNGILGDMAKGIVDISGSPFYYKEERMSACEFTVETYLIRSCFIFRHPKKDSLRNPFLKPFEKKVWIISLNLGLAFWGLLLIIIKLENHFTPTKTPEPHEDPSAKTALMTIAAVTQQGSYHEPHFYSGRIAFISLFLWAPLMYEFYSADIVGSLIAPPARFINTIRNLADSDLHLAFEDVAYIHDYFRTSNNPEHMYMYDKKLRPPRKRKTYTNAQDGLEQVSQGGYAFWIDTATAYKRIEDTFTQAQICELSEIEVLTPKYLSTVTAKHSPFKKPMIYGLQKIVEHGLSRRLMRIWQNRKPACPESFRSQPVPVELREFSAAMILIFCGLMLATGVMAAEHVATHHQRARQRLQDAWRNSMEGVEGTGTRLGFLRGLC